MIKKYIFLFIAFTALISNAQVGIGTTNPDNSAALDVFSTNSGILIPRMTQAQKLAIASPATGLLVYQTDNSTGFWYYNGVSWQPFSSGTGWNLLGNTGTNPATNKLGTIDNQSLVLKANTIENTRLLTNGNIGIGTNNPTNKLHLVSNPIFNYAQNFESLTSATNISNSSSNDPYCINNNTSCVAADGWRIETYSNGTCTNCSGKRAIIEYGSSTCVQDATLVVKLGSINLNSVDISFDYQYDDYDTSDQFVVTLYNETTSSIVATLINLTSADANLNFSGTYAVIAGNSYSLRFKYTGTYAAGATVDNIVVSGGTAVFTLQDGNQAIGKVLVSDANGNGIWTNTSDLGATDDDWRFASGSTTNDPIYRTGFIQVGNSNTPYELIEVEEPTGSGQDTQFGIGNNEYFQDVQSEQSISHHVVPIVNNTISLGSATLRWTEIFATNGTINTSDKRDKENIKPLLYGTKELMKLNPVSYQWKNEIYGKTVVSEKDKLRKIGFLAQDVLKTIPEVVETHEWKEINGNYKKVALPRLGVSYAEILPLVVKTIQEQETIISSIEKTQKEIDSLLIDLNKK